MIRVVELAGIVPQPWKNGGGITRDLLAWPQATDWQLRISVAEVARGGPFSAYPGITRWFAVVQGAGVVLRCGRHVHTLTEGSPPLRFDGADAPDCELIRGPTLDLNLLAATNAGSAAMQPVLPGVPWLAEATLRAVFTARPAELHVPGQAVTVLPALSLAFAWHGAGQPSQQPWQLRSEGAAPLAWWLAFTPHAP